MKFDFFLLPGSAGDSLSYHNGQAFSTKDRDLTGGKCAVHYTGAWWYKGCHQSNLNGQYLNGTISSNAQGMSWVSWKNSHYSVTRSEIKIRPVNV